VVDYGQGWPIPVGGKAIEAFSFQQANGGGGLETKMPPHVERDGEVVYEEHAK
jgi:hypothetical protein